MVRIVFHRGQQNNLGQAWEQLGKDTTMIRPEGFAQQRRAILCLGLLIIFIGMMPAALRAQSNPPPPTQGTEINHAGGHRMLSAVTEDSTVRSDGTHDLSDKQKRSIMHANFEKSKSDAAELAALAKGLREELDKPNVSVLSLDVMNRIDKIEKLAKKIREETKGF